MAYRWKYSTTPGEYNWTAEALGDVLDAHAAAAANVRKGVARYTGGGNGTLEGIIDSAANVTTVGCLVAGTRYAYGTVSDAGAYNATGVIYGTGSYATEASRNVDPGVAYVLTGHDYTILGVAKTAAYSPDFPAVSSVLTTDTVNGSAGTYQAVAASAVQKGVAVGVSPAVGTLVGTVDSGGVYHSTGIVEFGGAYHDLGILSTDGGTLDPTWYETGLYTGLYYGYGILDNDGTFHLSGVLYGGGQYATEASRNSDPGEDYVLAGHNYKILGDVKTSAYSPDFPDVGNVTTTDTVNGSSGTLNISLYTLISGVVSASYVVVGHDNYTGGSAGSYPTTATSQEAQLAADQAVVAGYLENIDGGVIILGQEGTGVNATTIRTALGLATANLDTQLAAIVEDTGTTLPATLTSMSGATFNAATDSLEAIRDRGDTAWITGSAGTGTGARTVTITVNDGTNVLEGAKVRFTKGAESYVGTTSVFGIVIFSLDDGTWTVSITLPLYSFTPTTLVVNGTETQTYSMTASTITAPTAPDTCTVQFRVYLSGVPVEGAVCKAKLIGVNQAIDGTILSNTDSSDTTDALGVAELELVQRGAIIKGSGIYDMRVEIAGNPVASVKTVIPNQSTVLFEDLL